MRSVFTAAIAASALGLAAPATAAGITFTGSTGSGSSLLSASVTFNILSGNVLQVVLTNTSPANMGDNASVLNAVFFNVAGTPTIGYSDADISAGSHWVGTPATPTTDPNHNDVGAEWAYKQSSSGLGQGVTQDYGFSSAGYNIFGPSNTLQGQAGHPDQGGSSQPPGGPDFGLVSAGYTGSMNSPGFTNQEPFIDNSVTFLLSNFHGSLSDISGVRFQYGTALSDTNIPGHPGPVPEPATWAMMLLGFGGVGVAMRRRRKPIIGQLA